MSAAVLAGLVKARLLLQPPLRWTSGAFARDALGLEIDPENLAACRFCAVGAVRRYLKGDEYKQAIAELTRAMPGADPCGYFTGDPDNLLDFNDSVNRTHADVLAVFDRAIAATNMDGGAS